MARIVRIATTLALAAGLACAGQPDESWEKPGGTAEQRSRDEADCMNRALIASDTGASGPSNRQRADREFDRCMIERGWGRVTR